MFVFWYCRDIYKNDKYMFKMYNSVLDLNFFTNTIKAILYYYGITQYLNFVQHGLLSCDDNFFCDFSPLIILYGFM